MTRPATNRACIRKAHTNPRQWMRWPAVRDTRLAGFLPETCPRAMRDNSPRRLRASGAFWSTPNAKTILAAAVAALTLTATAQAQAVCGKRADIIKTLQQKYGETRRSVGVQQGRGVVEVYASSNTGSWTIVITNARGLSCLMAAGEAFEALIESTKPNGTAL